MQAQITQMKRTSSISFKIEGVMVVEMDDWDYEVDIDDGGCLFRCASCCKWTTFFDITLTKSPLVWKAHRACNDVCLLASTRWYESVQAFVILMAPLDVGVEISCTAKISLVTADMVCVYGIKRCGLCKRVVQDDACGPTDFLAEFYLEVKSVSQNLCTSDKRESVKYTPLPNSDTIWDVLDILKVFYFENRPTEVLFWLKAVVHALTK